MGDAHQLTSNQPSPPPPPPKKKKKKKKKKILTSKWLPFLLLFIKIPVARAVVQFTSWLKEVNFSLSYWVKWFVYAWIFNQFTKSAAPRKKAVSTLLLNWEKASFVFYADFRWLPEKSIIKKKLFVVLRSTISCLINTHIKNKCCCFCFLSY